MSADKSLRENYTLLRGMCDAMEADLEKLQDGKVKASGARSRQSLLACKKLCDTMRKQVLEEVKAIPVKSRAKAVAPVDPDATKSASEEAMEEVVEEVVEAPKKKRAPRKKKKAV